MAMGIGTLVAASLVTSAVGTGFSLYTQGQAAKLQEKNIRLQQTALRIQETEASLQNMDQLEKVLARQEVMSGVRNIGANSGSLAALTNETFKEYDRINQVNELNFTSKRAALANQDLANNYERRNNMVKSGLGFAENALNVGMKYKSLVDMNDLVKRSGQITPAGAL